MKMQSQVNYSKMDTQTLIAEAYKSLRDQVFAYILYKINNIEDAKDLAQDVFVRLLDCGQMIREDTVKNMIFTISRNIVIDYLRRHYCRLEAMEYFMKNTIESSSYSESRIIADDIAEKEITIMKALPPQRQMIYRLVRFDEMNVKEIADKFDLSIRTVENHLAISRKEVRSYIKQCM